MNKKEILQALIDGKKIRNKEWEKECFLYLDPERGIVDEDGRLMGSSFNQEYEIYEEPPTELKPLMKISWGSYVGPISGACIKDGTLTLEINTRD